MQAIGRTSSVGAGTVHHIADRANRSNRNRHQKKNSSPDWNCNDFLKVSFDPIAPCSVVRDWNGEDYNYITQENYQFLRDSFFNYARLMNREVNHNSGKTVGEGIANLYNEMNLLIGGDLELNIEYREGKLYFNIWKTHRWGTNTLYWFPVKFLYKLTLELRRIAISFLHQLMCNNNFNVITEDSDLYYEFDYILEYVLESTYSEDDKERMGVFDLVESYQSGRISKLLKRIDGKCYYKNLLTAFQRYEPCNEFERKLIDTMNEGLQFIGADKPSIMNYSYDPYFEELQDYQPLDLGQQIKIVYDSYDLVTEAAINTINCLLQETYEITPRTTLELSPDTKTLFSMDDYPERFFGWSDKFIDLILFNYE